MRKFKLLFLMTSCKNSGPIKQMYYIIKNIDKSIFDVYLITMYTEHDDSRLDDFLLYAKKYYFIETSKIDIILNSVNKLYAKIDTICPDVIHTLGVFPDYTIARMKKYKQIHTMRNYIYDDYISKFGYIRGMVLSKIQLYAVDRANSTIACSKSLKDIYAKKLCIDMKYIRNGVDLDKYNLFSDKQKIEKRKKLNMPIFSTILIYTGNFIRRKNINYILNGYQRVFGNNKDTYLILLGDGEELSYLKNVFANNSQIDFRGRVNNVSEFLTAADIYVSASRSEGLPNGVIEAMACGLPVLLSDIPQHREFFEMEQDIGDMFRLDDYSSICDSMLKLYNKDLKKIGQNAHKLVCNELSAEKMANSYQEEYIRIIQDKM